MTTATYSLASATANAIRQQVAATETPATAAPTCLPGRDREGTWTKNGAYWRPSSASKQAPTRARSRGGSRKAGVERARSLPKHTVQVPAAGLPGRKK